MKTSTQIILVIVALLVLGIFWRFTGTYMQAKKEKQETQQAAELQAMDSPTVAVDTSLMDEPAAPQKAYIAIEPKSKWKDILTGEWSLSEEEKNENDDWQMNTDIEFLKNQTFDMHTTINYTDYHYAPASDGTHPANITGGGRVRGTWSINENAFELDLDTCTIERKFYSPYDHLRSIDYSEKEFRDSSFFKERIYGTISNDAYKTAIQIFNTDTILITGTNFMTGSDVTYLFVKK